MSMLKGSLRRLFDLGEGALARVFPPEWNPMLNLGALGFFFYWIITVSGIYIYIFFDTGVNNAYASIEYMTNEQWYLAGILRSLHRYASDFLIIVMLAHILREFARDRYRGVRWFSWVSGVPIMVMVFVAGISGYWLVWDKLAQYIAIVSTEWLDLLPIFGEPIARNFLSPDALESRFFTLMIFMHIAIPLIALAILWIHLQRITKPRINPPRGLAVLTFGGLIALSLVQPAVSHAPANLAEVPGDVGLDWFYLPLFPLLETLPASVTWGMGGVFMLIMVAIPWLPPFKKLPVAVVDLPNCNGCARCFNDCPYGAIELVARTDGTAFERQPIVDPDKCVACGICAGSCPTSTPFRRMSDLVPGIDLPDRTIADIREQLEATSNKLEGENRIIVFNCDHGPKPQYPENGSIGMVTLACIGQLPPSFIDYAISRNLADGVVLTGCRQNSCESRFGIEWTKQRLARERDPYLRSRVDEDRIKTAWVGINGASKLQAKLDQFQKQLADMPEKPRSKRKKFANQPTDGGEADA